MEKIRAKNKLLSQPVILGVLAVALLAFPQVVAQPYYLQIAVTVLIYCCWASAWNIIGGYAGQFAMGNGVYIGIGGYTAAIFYQEGIASPWIGMIVGALISVFFAAIISLPCFRLSGTYFSLATVAFLHIVRYVILGSNTLFGVKTGGGVGMIIRYTGRWQDMQFADKSSYYYVVVLFLAVILLVSNHIRKSKMGYYLAAINTNQGAASTIGVDVVRYKLIAQCISAFFLAAVGAFYVFYLYNVNPYKVLGYPLSLEIMIYCVIGGLGTLWGPIIGACSLGLINEILRVNMGSNVAPLASVFYGVALILIVRFAPGGLISLVYQAKAALAKRFSKDDPQEAMASEPDTISEEIESDVKSVVSEGTKSASPATAEGGAEHGE